MKLQVLALTLAYELQSQAAWVQIFSPDLLHVCPWARHMASCSHIYYMEVVAASTLWGCMKKNIFQALTQSTYSRAFRCFDSYLQAIFPWAELKSFIICEAQFFLKLWRLDKKNKDNKWIVRESSMPKHFKLKTFSQASQPPSTTCRRLREILQ